VAVKRFFTIFGCGVGVFAAAFNSFQAGTNAVAVLATFRRGVALKMPKTLFLHRIVIPAL
jgi:uncharacterized membrane protein